MNALQANAVVSAMLTEAQAAGPRDPFTLFAFTLNSILKLILIPTMLLVPIVTFALGILVSLTFGLLLFLLSLIWLPIFGLLLGTSWLWLRAWYLRPILIIPGVITAFIGSLYVRFVPDMGEKYQKVLKLGYCDAWPWTYTMFRISLTVQDE